MTLPVLEIHPTGAPRRQAVETFIHDVFAQHFGATLRGFMPELVSLSDDAGAITAAAGIRAAACGPLFVERYLDQSIERTLEARVGQRICRARIVEVGNLATRTPGRARPLFREITRHLDLHGYEWAVFAGTLDVRAVFRRLGVELVRLCDADGQRLGDARFDWGNYYENRPIVMAGSIAAGCRQLGLQCAVLTLGDFTLLSRAAVACPG
jgi:Thermostable hemolysin